MEIKEAVELQKDERSLGIVAKFEDDSVGVVFDGECYVTSKNQPKVYYIAQAWYSGIIPNLRIKKVL